MKSEDSDDSSSRVMLYLHGGGYEFGSCKSHRVFVSRLCRKLKVQAYSINYRLAPENPEVSPLFADFNGFPSIFIQVGTREILLNDTLIIAEKMQKQGVNVTLDVQEGMFHKK